MSGNEPTGQCSSESSMKILGVCNHLGGANAIFPVLEKLSSEMASVHVVTTSLSVDKFKNTGITVDLVSGRVNRIEVQKKIQQVDPDLLLVGTSEPEDHLIGRLESCFIHEACRERTPSVAVLDHWSGYLDRFSFTEEWDAVPDLICVMDERARLELAQLGCPSDRLIVTGNPDWDRLKDVRLKLENLDRTTIRADFGVSDSDCLIVFVSQPLSNESGGKHTYSETNILAQLMESVRIKERFGSTRVIIKPHGREQLDKFDSFVSQSGGKVQLTPPGVDAYTVGMAGDAAIGMFSMLLVEYSLLGFNAFSYQPGSTKEKINLGYGVRDLLRLEDLWQSMALPKIVSHNPPDDATENVIEVLERVIKPKLFKKKAEPKP